MENNPHKILGISQRASVKDIKTAYKRRLKRLREEYPDGDQNDEFRSKAAAYAKAKEDLLREIKHAAELKGLSEETYAKQKKQNRLFAVLVIVIIAAIASIPILSYNGVIGTGANANRGKVVAKIGGTEIKQGLVDGLAAYMTYSNYGQLLGSYETANRELMKNQTLVTAIVPTELIRAHFKAAGEGKLDKEERSAVRESVDAAYADATMRQTLAEQGIPRTAVQYYYEMQVYMTKFSEEVLAADPVTDEEAQAYYDENESYFNTPEQKTASHILIKDPDHTPEKLAEIEDILAKAKAGEDFAELAKEYSEDTSAESGGDLGSFGEVNNFVPEFSEAAWALQNVDDISDVVETEFGYHIIKLTGKTDASTTPLEDVRDSIVTYLEQERSGAAAEALKDEIPVEYYVYVDPETGEPPITSAALQADPEVAAAMAAEEALKAVSEAVNGISSEEAPASPESEEGGTNDADQ